MLMHQDVWRGVHLNQKHYEKADNNTILNGMT